MPQPVNFVGARNVSRSILRIFLIAALAVSGIYAHAARVCDVTAYGARATASPRIRTPFRAPSTPARPRAAAQCDSPGTFLTGPIVLKSHITLEVNAGATLLGSQDKADYPQVQELREPALQPLVSATNAEHIVIRGGGTIDGNGKPWWDAVYAHRAGSNFVAAMRPRLILFDHCKHILIENMTIQNSASWQVVPYYSDDVVIRNGKILAPARSPNTDGAGEGRRRECLGDNAAALAVAGGFVRLAAKATPASSSSDATRASGRVGADGWLPSRLV